jgi:hypothetical protein
MGQPGAPVRDACRMRIATCSGSGGGAWSARQAVARPGTAGATARLAPRPTTSHSIRPSRVAADSTSTPASFAPWSNRSFGHFRRSAAGSGKDGASASASATAASSAHAARPARGIGAQQQRERKVARRAGPAAPVSAAAGGLAASQEREPFRLAGGGQAQQQVGGGGDLLLHPQAPARWRAVSPQGR